MSKIPLTQLISKLNRSNRRQRFKVAGLIGLLLTIFLTTTAGAAIVSLKYSGFLRQEYPGFEVVRYDDFSISPNGQYVVYVASQSPSLETVELYSAFILGGSPIKLSGPLEYIPAKHLVSSDSSRVVYLADEETEGVFELYSVPLTGGASTKLNGPLVNEGNVSKYFKISPDSSRVVYIADQDIDGDAELYSVPLTGGESSVKLNIPVLESGDIFREFHISPDSSRVVYQFHTSQIFNLYSVSITGGSPLKLNVPVGPGKNMQQIRISPDSQRAIYVANHENPDRYDLFSVSLTDGTPPLRLNDPLPVEKDADVDYHFQISPDSSRVVYKVEQDAVGVWSLYSVPLTGGTPTRLHEPPAPYEYVDKFQISPDSSRVIYRADHDTNDVFELYSVPLTGGASPIKLNGPLVAGKLIFSDFQISPDSDWVVYRDQDTDDGFELYSVPITGGASPIKLNGPLASSATIEDFKISPDSSRVIYRADQDKDNVPELYSVPLSGGELPIKLNNPLVDSRVVFHDYKISPNNNYVVYRSSYYSEFDHTFYGLFVAFDDTIVHYTVFYLPVVLRP